MSAYKPPVTRLQRKLRDQTKNLYDAVMLDVLQRLRDQLREEKNSEKTKKIIQTLQITWNKNMQATRFWEPNDLPPFRARAPSEVSAPPSPARKKQQPPSASTSLSSSLLSASSQNHSQLPPGRGVGMSDPSSASDEDFSGWDELLMAGQKQPDFDASGDGAPEEPELTDADDAVDVESLNLELNAPNANNYIVSRAMEVVYKRGVFHLTLHSAILHINGKDEVVDVEGSVDFANPARE